MDRKDREGVMVMAALSLYRLLCCVVLCCVVLCCVVLRFVVLRCVMFS